MRKADNLPPSCAVVTKSGSLNLLEPSGPVQTFTLRWNVWFHIERKDHRLPTHGHQLDISHYRKLQNAAEHGRLLGGERTVPSFMVQLPLRAAGPTQGHTIHTLTQVVLLHDSICLSSAFPKKFTSAQILYYRRRRHCHLAIVITLVFWVGVVRYTG